MRSRQGIRPNPSCIGPFGSGNLRRLGQGTLIPAAGLSLLG
jgi:hypothetical protein